MRIALSEDMKAYKELYLLMFDKLFKFSYSLVKSKEAAEELVSDVFIKLWSIKMATLGFRYYNQSGKMN